MYLFFMPRCPLDLGTRHDSNIWPFDLKHSVPFDNRLSAVIL
uniref:Uncharacterized protein n=1 Tax=Anopheles quadriannulatus TaxID=34691 RepID=A0A182XRI7_ANOQN